MEKEKERERNYGEEEVQHKYETVGREERGARIRERKVIQRTSDFGENKNTNKMDSGILVFMRAPFFHSLIKKNQVAAKIQTLLIFLWIIRIREKNNVKLLISTCCSLLPCTK